MRAALLAVGFTVMMSGVAVAAGIDELWRVTRSRNCADYVSAYAKTARNPNDGVAIASWLIGYTTAINLWRPGTFDISDEMALKGIMLRLEIWCRNNPIDDIAIGMEIMVYELDPKRQQGGP